MRAAIAIRYTVALLVAVACTRLPNPGSSSQAASHSVESNVAEPTDAKTLPEVGSPPPYGFADIATAPVQLWAGVADDGVVERIIIVGHAELLCCKLLSGVEGAALTLGKVSGYATHGFSDLRVNDNPESIFALQEVLSVAEESRRMGAECAAMVHIHDFELRDIEEREVELREQADQGIRLARELGRPLLLWHDNPGGAPLSPGALATSRDHGLVDLNFRLSLRKIALPEGFLTKPTQLRGELSKARRAVAQWKNFAAFTAEQERLERKGTERIVGERELKLVRGEFARASRQIRSHNTCIKELRRWWRRLAQIRHDFGGSRDPDAGAAAQELSQMLLRNERTLAWLDDRAASNEQGATFVIATCETKSRSKSRRTAKSRRFDGSDALKASRAELDRWLELAARLELRDVSTLVDTGLRGIPLSFGDEEDASLFDQWVARNQKRMWAELGAQADGVGVNFSTPDSDAGLLHASNLVMRVSRDGDELEISPHFVLSGPFYQVIDPDRGLIYYESAIAEHHLGARPQVDEERLVEPIPGEENR